MKITKTANNKKKITISKKEWESIGKTAGWMKLDDGRDASGQEDLGDGYIFMWMYDKDGTEISGQVLDSEGKMVEGTYGWYRTDSVEEAKEEAKQKIPEKSTEYAEIMDNNFGNPMEQLKDLTIR